MHQGIELTLIVSAGHNVDPKHHQEEKEEMRFYKKTLQAIFSHICFPWSSS